MTSPEKPLVEQLADLAASLAPGLDLRRSPDAHVHQALDTKGYRYGHPERKKLISDIKKELHRRSTRPPLSERQDLIEDARIQELRHPKDEDEG